MKGDWYFDSGSSCHMTGEKNYLSNLKTVNLGKVTFGVFGKIVGKGKLNFPSLPILNDVILVEGLTAILLASVSFVIRV